MKRLPFRLRDWAFVVGYFIALAGGLSCLEAQLAPPNVTARTEVARTASTPVDFAVVTNGAAGSLVTVTQLTSGMIGSFSGWTWTLVTHNPAQHTRVLSQPLVRRTPFRISGAFYDGAGYASTEYDLTAAKAIGSSPLYESQRFGAPAGLSNGLSIGGLTRFGMLNGSSGCSIDTYQISCGGYVVAQYNVQSTGNGVIRTEGNGGNIGRNVTIPSRIVVYSWSMRANNSNDRGEFCLVDNDTGIVLGTSECAIASGVGDVTSILRQSYLLLSASGGGVIDHGILGVDYTNIAFPLEPVTISAPTVVLLQTAPGEVLVTWSGGSVCQRNSVERSSDGGATYSTLNGNLDAGAAGAFQYYDTTASTATSYVYRVSGLVGSLTGTGGTASITVDDTIFITAQTISLAGAQYGTVAATLTGLADSTVVSGSLWVNMTGSSDGTLYTIFEGYGSDYRWHIDRTAANRIEFRGRNSSSTSQIWCHSTSTILAAGGWKHIYYTLDTTSSANCKLYINLTQDTLVQDISPVGGAIDFAMSSPGYRMGGTKAGAQLFIGYLSEFWIDDVALDTPTAFARKSSTAVVRPITITAAGGAARWSLNGSGNNWYTDSINSNNLAATGTAGSPTPPP